MAAHEDYEGAADVDREQGHGDGGDDGPDDEGVPLPLPDVADETPGMVAEVLDLAAAEWEAAGVEEIDAELDEGDEEKEMDGGDGVRADLGGDLIEAEGPCEHDDDEGGEADGGIDADDHAEGEAPGETAGGDAAAELAQERTQDAAAQELADGFGQEHRAMLRFRRLGGRARLPRGVGRCILPENPLQHSDSRSHR